MTARLMEKYEVIGMANEGDLPMWGDQKPIDVGLGRVLETHWIPNALGRPAQTVAMVNSYCERLGIDLLIAHWDSWALDFLRGVDTPSLQYVPVDSQLTPKWANTMKGSRKVVLYSWYGYRQALAFFHPSEIDYIAHGVDCGTFKPLGRPKSDLREEMAPKHIGKIPADAFLMTYTGANIGERKNLPLLLRTFKRFLSDHPDSHIYLHTNVNGTGQGYEMDSMVSEMGIRANVHAPKVNPVIAPATDEEFCKLYNMSDVFVSNSSGEGYGLPLAESQACGLPAIAPSNSSQRELVEGHGYLVYCLDDMNVDYPQYVPTGNFYRIPDQRSLLAQMEAAYKVWKTGDESLRKAARDFALGYDWSQVMPRWMSLLREQEEELEMQRILTASMKVKR